MNEQSQEDLRKKKDANQKTLTRNEEELKK
jgi:hypothetical protein